MVILQATQDIGIDNYGFKHSVETLQDVKAKEEVRTKMEGWAYGFWVAYPI